MGKGRKLVFITSLTDTKTEDVETVGTIRREGNNVYKWVQYNVGAGAVAAVANQVAYYYQAGGYATGQVTSDLSDSVNIGAGVLMSAPNDTEYCWIQIQGPATLALALTAGADGNALTPVGSTDGTLDVSAAVTDHICAIADDASAKSIICQFPY